MSLANPLTLWWLALCGDSMHVVDPLIASLGRMTAIAICYQIWSFRNNKIYDGMIKPFIHARLVVIDTLQFVEHLVHPSIASSKFGQDSLAMISIVHRGPLVSRLRRRAWEPPSVDRQALHIAGISLPLGASVGGVLRDHHGAFLGDVVGPSGLGFDHAVDVHALLRGLELAGQARCFSFDVWTQSRFLVDNISMPSPLWNCEHSWATIQAFSRHHGLGLHHSIRRGCAIAGAMAEWEILLERLTFIFSIDGLPSAVWRAIAWDACVFVDPGG